MPDNSQIGQGWTWLKANEADVHLRDELEANSGQDMDEGG